MNHKHTRVHLSHQLLQAALTLLITFTTLGLHAQTKPTMATLFKAMPDSIMPYLSQNNRLDMIDFMEAKMKAEVTNLLSGRSTMTALTDDSLSISMNDVLTVDMHAIETSEPVDSSNVVIYLQRTYRIDGQQAEVIVDVYSATWRHLSSNIKTSSLLRRDESLQRQ